MRWDQSARCRALIDHDRLVMIREQEEIARHPEWKDQDIRVNEHWHERNLDMLEECIAHIHDRNYYAFEPLYYCYMREEHHRLGERLTIMKRYHIDVLPPKHKERQHILQRKFIQALEAKGEQHE